MTEELSDKASAILFEVGGGDRIAVPDPSEFPWRSVARINLLRQGNIIANASAVLVAPDIVLTAKHVFTEPHDDREVILGYDLVLGKGLVAAELGIDAHPTRDVAMLLLKPVDPPPFLLGFIPTPAVMISGYPVGSPKQMMGHGASKSAGHLLEYAIPVKRGDSGAPVFVRDGRQARCVAIHSEKHSSKGFGEILDPTFVHELKQIADGLRAKT